MLNRRMFQRGKDNNFFWFHEQSNIFFHVKVYLCYIKENSMTVNEAHLIYFSPTHTHLNKLRRRLFTGRA